MTAICGSWHLDGAPGAGEECARMQAALAPYGRDRSDRRDLGDIALGIRLARMLPEDRFDRQPLTGAGGRLLLLADARIDNRPELAEALGLADERRAGLCDAAYVLAAWERWGEDCLDRIEGSYAFVLWDQQARILRLVRDPLGRRPLFVHQAHRRLHFASMAKGLHALPDVPRAPDADMVRDFLALLPHAGPRSFFAGIERVEPGGMLRCHADGRIEAIAWYDRMRDRAPRFRRPEDYAEAFRSLFDRAVADALRTDGGIASHLSAGRDSGVVTATAAAMLAARGERLTSYTHVPLPGAPLQQMPGRFGDEGPGAARVAAMHANIDHVLVDCAGRRIGDDFDSNFHYYEYPPLNPTHALWLSEINRRAAAGGATVLLNGQFGNMTISIDGFERLPELLGRGRLFGWARETWALVRNGHSPRALLSASLLPFLPHDAIRQLRRAVGRTDVRLEDFSPLRDEVIASPAFRQRVAELGFDTRYRPWRDGRAMQRMMLWRGDYLAQNRKGVLAAHGIDVRDPTSDLRLIAFTAGLPSDLFLRDGQPAWLFKAAFGARLPAETVAARRKGLQSADWATRLQRDLPDLAPLLDRAEHSPTAAALIDLPRLRADAAALPTLAGQPHSAQTVRTYHLRLIRGLAMAHFLIKLEGGNH